MAVRPAELLARLPRGLLAGCALMLALSLFLPWAYQRYQFHVAAMAANQQAARVESATQLAVQLGEALQPALDRLQEYAQDPRVVAAASAAANTEREPLETEIAEAIPGALRVRLLPPDVAQPDDSTRPPLSYVTLDQIRRAMSDSGLALAEMHAIGTADEHLSVIRRVPPTGVPVGLLQLALSPKRLSEPLSRLELHGLQAELTMPAAGERPLVVARTAERRAGEAELAHNLVPGTALQLHLRGPGGLHADETGSEEGISLLPLAMAAVVVAGLLALALVRAARTASPETTDWQGAVRAILEGQYPGLEALTDPNAPLPEPQPFDPTPEWARRPVPAEPAPEPAPVGAGKLPSEPPAVPQIQAGATVPPGIFREYDIRGVVGESLTPEVVLQLGRAIASEALALGQPTVVVARDGRLSGPALLNALTQGLRGAGCDVLDIGMVPTPVLYFATHYLDLRTGVMLTGSHNPPEYNGLKIVLDGRTLSGDAIQAIRRRIEGGEFAEGDGRLEHTSILTDYIARIGDDVPMALDRPLRVVVDGGNGVPGLVAPDVLRALGHDVLELHCEVDGSFPNHPPDPSQPENLQDLIISVKHEKADLGLAFDGDGDRLAVVDGQGNIIWPDRQLMLFARDLLQRHPGARVIYDVKCSRKLADVIRAAGGEPEMWRSGHSLIKARMEETGAMLAGEMTGHLFFGERWYGFDDAIYAAARLLEIIGASGKTPTALFAELPTTVATPELHLALPESEHATFMASLMPLAEAAFADAEISHLDGLRVDYPDRWGLVRPSNTTPNLVLRFEGDDGEALASIENEFRNLLRAVDPTIALTF